MQRQLKPSSMSLYKTHFETSNIPFSLLQHQEGPRLQMNDIKRSDLKRRRNHCHIDSTQGWRFQKQRPASRRNDGSGQTASCNISDNHTHPYLLRHQILYLPPPSTLKPPQILPRPIPIPHSPLQPPHLLQQTPHPLSIPPLRLLRQRECLLKFLDHEGAQWRFFALTVVVQNNVFDAASGGAAVAFG